MPEVVTRDHDFGGRNITLEYVQPGDIITLLNCVVIVTSCGVIRGRTDDDGIALGFVDRNRVWSPHDAPNFFRFCIVNCHARCNGP